MASILIIGGAGIIGSNLIKPLCSTHKVVVYEIKGIKISRLIHS